VKIIRPQCIISILHNPFRLKEMLQERLVECGWMDNLKEYCKGTHISLLSSRTFCAPFASLLRIFCAPFTDVTHLLHRLHAQRSFGIKARMRSQWMSWCATHTLYYFAFLICFTFDSSTDGGGDAKGKRCVCVYVCVCVSLSVCLCVYVCV
jgi:hypothetical protein